MNVQITANVNYPFTGLTEIIDLGNLPDIFDETLFMEYLASHGFFKELVTAYENSISIFNNPSHLLAKAVSSGNLELVIWIYNKMLEMGFDYKILLYDDQGGLKYVTALSTAIAEYEKICNSGILEWITSVSKIDDSLGSKMCNDACYSTLECLQYCYSHFGVNNPEIDIYELQTNVIQNGSIDMIKFLHEKTDMTAFIKKNVSSWLNTHMWFDENIRSPEILEWVTKISNLQVNSATINTIMLIAIKKKDLEFYRKSNIIIKQCMPNFNDYKSTFSQIIRYGSPAVLRAFINDKKLYKKSCISWIRDACTTINRTRNLKNACILYKYLPDSRQYISDSLVHLILVKQNIARKAIISIGVFMMRKSLYDGDSLKIIYDFIF